MNTKIDRDEIKSQLKEGLKHTKKILKNKKGKKNEDLIFTLGTKQFLINRCDVGYTQRHRRNGEKQIFSPKCFFITESEKREEEINAYLEDDISTSKSGSKELSLYLVGDMSKYNNRSGWSRYGQTKGIDMPYNLRSQGGFAVADLDVLMSDDKSLETYSRHFDEERKDKTYLDFLVDILVPFIDENYLENCFETNRRFYDEYVKIITDAIYNGWKENVLTDIGKALVTERFINSLSTEEYKKSVNFELETLEFKSRFNDNLSESKYGLGVSLVRQLRDSGILPEPEDFLSDCVEQPEKRYKSDGIKNLYELTAWARVENEILTEVA